MKVQGYTSKSAKGERLNEAYALSQLVREIPNCKIAAFETLKAEILSEFSITPENFQSKELSETIKNLFYLSQIYQGKDADGSNFITQLESKYIDIIQSHV